MLTALSHRGPDDSGVEEIALTNGWRLGLTQTRLSIMDLSPTGHQPMVDAKTGSWIVFNGEVYNHADVRRELPSRQYRSTGDTETVLHGWIERGPEILHSLRGMYAFALWDATRQQLHLVRDRLGIKPLYAAKSPAGDWLFASEIRALLATGMFARKIHRLALESYLASGAVAAPWTMVNSIESLMPGERWCFDFRKHDQPVPEKTTYWTPAFASPNGKVWRRDEALEMLKPVLAESTRLRMVADVPVGVFLSGGIDSSSVVSSLVSQGHNLHTFAIVFDEKDFDESTHSRKVATEFGTNHTELRLRPSEMLARFGEAIAAYDQPSIDGVNTYFISEATRKAGVKVALSGLGGDELFAGYPYFRVMQRLANPLRRTGYRAAEWVGRWLRPDDVRFQKLHGVMSSSNRLDQYAFCRQVMSNATRSKLLRQSCSAESLPLDADFAGELAGQVDGLDAVNAHSRLELSLYLSNTLLRDTDQMSMAHALEVREPLLDHVLVETLGRIPGDLKLLPGKVTPTKGLLADALERPLPESVVARRKMGFVLPWERWLRAELASSVDASFADHERVESLGLNPAAVQSLWQDFRAGKPNVRHTDILCLHHLLAWSKHNDVA